MDSYAHRYKLATLKCSEGLPLDAFKKVPLRVNAEGYEISPLLLDMLQTKRFAGDDNMEDPYAHIDFFDDICRTFKLNVFTEEEMRFFLAKLFLTKH